MASDNVNEDKPVSFVVQQPGSFNLKMHLGHGGGRRLKPSPSCGASQRVKADRRWARERKVGAKAGLDWFDNLRVFSLLVPLSDCFTFFFFFFYAEAGQSKKFLHTKGGFSLGEAVSRRGEGATR